MVIGILVVVYLAIVLMSLMDPVRYAGRLGSMSNFELKRRAKKGDGGAESELRRGSLLPNVMVLRNLLMIVFFLAFFIVIAVVYGDWGWALLCSTVGFVATGPISHLKPVAHFAHWLYTKMEPGMLRLVARLNVVFDFFRDTEIDSHVDMMRAGSKEELTHVVMSAGNDVVSEDEKLIILSALKFRDVRVSEVMLPVGGIKTVEADLALTPSALDRLHKAGFNYLPVVDGDIDHIVGILDLSDVQLEDIKDAPAVREKMLRKVYFIRRDHSLETALAAFVRTNFHLFVVIDEDRETVGLLTLRDLLESLVGRAVADDFVDDSNSDAVARRRANNSPRGRVDI